MVNYRFPDIASWSKKEIINENEIRSNTKKISFRCVAQTLKSKAITSDGNGATITSARVALRTDWNGAKDIEPDDAVLYKNYSYSVVSVDEVRSLARLNAKEYIIGLV